MPSPIHLTNLQREVFGSNPIPWIIPAALASVIARSNVHGDGDKRVRTIYSFELVENGIRVQADLDEAEDGLYARLIIEIDAFSADRKERVVRFRLDRLTKEGCGDFGTMTCEVLK